MPSTGRLLGVDYGAKRVGLAISDRDRRLASPHAIHHRNHAIGDARFFTGLVREEGIVGMVVGLPVHASGQEGQKAREAKAYGAWLASTTGLPVVFWDERFTTVEAERQLLDAGLTKKRRLARLDMVAAQILLQTYLNAGCPADTEARALDDPSSGS